MWREWIEKIKEWLGMARKNPPGRPVPKEDKIKVPVDDATNSQILEAIYKTVTRMEKHMSELTDAVSALTTAVGSLSSKIGERVDALNAALSEAQSALTNFTLADEIEDANFTAQINDLQAALDSALGDAATAVAGIQGAVTAIDQVTNAADADPSTPVEEPPVEEPVEAAPAEEPVDSEPAPDE